MDENLNSVNAEQGSVVENPEPEVTTGESESAAPAEQPVAEAATDTPTATPDATPKEKTPQTPEENAQFKALRLEERQKVEQAAAQKAKDEVFARLAKDAGVVGVDGKPIQTESDFIAYQEYARQVQSLTSQGVSEDAAKLRIRNEQLERERSDRLAAEEQKAKREHEFADFFTYFRELHNRDWDRTKDPIPDEVREANISGVPLKYAYADYFAKEQQRKLQNIEIGKKTAEVNAANAETATGSVSGGSGGSGEITQAEIDRHANDTPWMMKNYPRVQEFLQKKKG